MFAPLSHLVSAANVLFTAARVSNAVEMHAQPDPRDLQRLGIEPKAFASVRQG